MLPPLCKATVITDASFCPTTRAAGFGAWVTLDNAGGPPRRIKKGGRLNKPPQSSEGAEFYAAMNGIWYAYQAGARDILLQTDNMGVVSVINCTTVKSPLRSVYADIRLAHFQGATIRAKHVKGHTNVQDARSFVNRWCDEVAGKHMRAARKLLPYSKPKKKKRRKARANG